MNADGNTRKAIPVIDTHCHVLPEIDDGSRSVEESLQMLHMMRSGGVDIAVATPHFYRKRANAQQFLERRAESFGRLKAGMDESCPEIILGAEVAFFFGISEYEELSKLCIGGTKTLLLEMPTHSTWGDYEFCEIQSLVLDRNFDVIIAHYERYRDVQTNNYYYRAILDLPVYIQLTADTVRGAFRGKFSLDLLKNGSAHLLGSDAHNTTDRIPNLHTGRQIISKKIGAAKLDEIDRLAYRLMRA